MISPFATRSIIFSHALSVGGLVSLSSSTNEKDRMPGLGSVVGLLTPLWEVLHGANPYGVARAVPEGSPHEAVSRVLRAAGSG